MSKLKHTPGPWQIGSWGIHTPYLIKAFDILIVDANKDAGIAHVQRRYTKEQTEANARLLAAAPDMLEALIETCKQLTNGNPAITDTVWTDCVIDETLFDKCSLIIEKATGLSIEEILE